MTSPFATSLASEFQSLHACNPQINDDNFCALLNDHSYANQWCEPTCYKVHVVQVHDFDTSSVLKSGGSSSGNEEDDSQKLIAQRRGKASTKTSKRRVQCSKGHKRRRWATSRAQESEEEHCERCESERIRHAAFTARETSDRHLERLALRRKAWAEMMAEKNEQLNLQKIQLDQERKSIAQTNKSKLQTAVTLSGEKQILSSSRAPLSRRPNYIYRPITEKHENKLRSAVMSSSSVPLSQRPDSITHTNENKLQYTLTDSAKIQRISSSVPLFQKLDQKTSLAHPNVELVTEGGKTGLAVIHIEQNLTQDSHLRKIIKFQLSSANDTSEDHCYAKSKCKDDKGLHDDALSSERIPSITSELRGLACTWKEANAALEMTSEEQNANERLHPSASLTTCPQLYPHMIKSERTETVQEQDKLKWRYKQKKWAFTPCCEDVTYLNEQIDFYS